MSNYWLGKQFSKEHLANLRKARAGRKPNLGTKLSKQAKLAMSKRYKLRWSDPIYREKMRKIHQKRHIDNPGYFKKIALMLPKGDKSPQWLGDDIGYFGIHKWLLKVYGKATKCENIDCLKINKMYEWAKLRDKQYKRRRNHFIQLCRSCHRYYDRGRLIRVE